MHIPKKKLVDYSHATNTYHVYYSKNELFTYLPVLILQFCIRLPIPVPRLENAMNRYNIGRRIEAYRDRLKMSTQELAGRIHRSQATISRIENGKQGLTFELLSSIASELRVHPFALLADSPPPADAFPRSGEGADAAVEADEVDMFLNKLSVHLVNALKDRELRRKIFYLAGLSGPPEGEEGGDPTESE
jgi:transcriptional regulator with XRE-family HTH domain